MIYRDIYRAIEWDGKYIMTNRVEALFLCRALVLMRLIWVRGDMQSFVLFQTLLPTPSVTFIGIILSLASLWHWHYWSTVLCFSNGTPLSAEYKLQQRKEVQFIGSEVPFSDVLMVCLPNLLHFSRQVMCEVSCPYTPPWSYVAHPYSPFQALMPQWESRSGQGPTSHVSVE